MWKRCDIEKPTEQRERGREGGRSDERRGGKVRRETMNVFVGWKGTGLSLMDKEGKRVSPSRDGERGRKGKREKVSY